MNGREQLSMGSKEGYRERAFVFRPAAGLELEQGRQPFPLIPLKKLNPGL